MPNVAQKSCKDLSDPHSKLYVTLQLGLIHLSKIFKNEVHKNRLGTVHKEGYIHVSLNLNNKSCLTKRG